MVDFDGVGNLSGAFSDCFHQPCACLPILVFSLPDLMPCPASKCLSLPEPLIRCSQVKPVPRPTRHALGNMPNLPAEIIARIQGSLDAQSVELSQVASGVLLDEVIARYRAKLQVVMPKEAT